MTHRSRKNPSRDTGLSTDTIVLVGLGTALLGAIIYAIYEIGQTRDTLAATNEQIGTAAQSAQSVSDQIGQASQSAQNVGTQIQAANQTIQQSSAVQAANAAASWWQNL